MAPVSDRAKINSFRRWEQAFRIYATIYTGANPTRSKEIWQYVSVISTAANSFTWECVYNYDVTFRHLMAFNPQRSWAITYNQMWNLAMREPLTSSQKFQNNSFTGVRGSKQGKGRRPKSNYCWSFNKGVNCKFGKNCRFIERCSYCDSPTHGVHACPKLDKKEQHHKKNHNSKSPSLKN